MVVAHVKIGRVKVIDGSLVPDAGVSSLRPVDDECTEFDVVVNGVVLELFFFYLFKSISELIVHPVDEIHNPYGRLNQLDLRLS